MSVPTNGTGTLAKTGAGVALFGGTAAFSWTIATIVLLVVAGAVLYRAANRGRRYES
ncbi:hypothetical protein [Streptomyces sp. NPDC094468]|uniref:hypothetical protein n=1 Tax=Streptomyces sp. NPDC094468 TaxID=3366066 RepID=UPI003812FE6C